MGVIGRPHGVRGLLHVHSFTADPVDLPEYGPFVDARGRSFSLHWESEGVARVAEIVDGKKVPVADRTGAERLVNVALLVPRDRLPPAEEDEFYVADLVGLEAVTPEGEPVGRIDAVHDYGAGTSIEIGRLIVPFTKACVPVVDIAAGRVVVAPPAEIVAGEAGA
jgi:16S rRNA processing protein RimM